MLSMSSTAQDLYPILPLLGKSNLVRQSLNKQHKNKKINVHLYRIGKGFCYGFLHLIDLDFFIFAPFPSVPPIKTFAVKLQKT